MPCAVAIRTAKAVAEEVPEVSQSSLGRLTQIGEKKIRTWCTPIDQKIQAYLAGTDISLQSWPAKDSLHHNDCMGTIPSQQKPVAPPCWTWLTWHEEMSAKLDSFLGTIQKDETQPRNFFSPWFWLFTMLWVTLPWWRRPWTSQVGSACVGMSFCVGIWNKNKPQEQQWRWCSCSQT